MAVWPQLSHILEPLVSNTYKPPKAIPIPVKETKVVERDIPNNAIEVSAAAAADAIPVSQPPIPSSPAPDAAQRPLAIVESVWEVSNAVLNLCSKFI